MDGAGDQLFAGAALAADDDGAVGGGDGADGLLEPAHGLALADEIVERVVLRGVALEGGVLLAQLGAVQGQGGGAQHIFEEFGTFADVVEGSGVEGLDGNFGVIDGGDDDDHGVGRDAARVLEDFHAGDAGHAHVGDDNVVESGVKLAAGLLARGHRLDAVSLVLERDLQHLADGALIITDQDVSHDYLLSSPQLRARELEVSGSDAAGGLAGSSGIDWRKSKVNSLPLPGSERTVMRAPWAWMMR